MGTWENVKGFSCVREGQFPEDCSTAVMVYAKPYIYQLRWRHLERYNPEKDTWYEYLGVAVLPEIVGPGAGIRYLYRGHGTHEFWRIRIDSLKEATC